MPELAKGVEFVYHARFRCQSCEVPLSIADDNPERILESARDIGWSDGSGEWLCEGCQGTRMRKY